MTRWWAQMRDTDAILAEGDTSAECHAAAVLTGVPGAAYYITDVEPDPCTWCHGNGTYIEYQETLRCGPCEGTGYSAGKAEGAKETTDGQQDAAVGGS